MAFPPALGPVRSGTGAYRRGALLAALAGAQLVAAAWVVAQYSVEVQWVKVRRVGGGGLALGAFPLSPPFG